MSPFRVRYDRVENKTLVSIIIVNYNGKSYVERCVRSVYENVYPDYEVIVVDNGSTDGSVSYLHEVFGDKSLRIIALDKNYGPAYARNRGIDAARGDYFAFLDNDTEPEPGWLVEPIKAMETDPTIGACQCKLLLMNERNRLDYVGDYLSPLGFLIQRVPGGTIDDGQADERVEILSAKSAAMVSRAVAVKTAGGFDEDYFIYVEETDLAWRIWLLGYRVIFIPESRVYHEFGTSTVILGKHQNFLVKFHGPKNYITTLVKNYELRNLLRVLPIHLSLWFGLALFLAIKGQPRDTLNIIKGIGWVFFNLRAVWRKRRRIQCDRKVSDRILLPKIMRRVGLNYFFQKASSRQRIGNAQPWQRAKDQLEPTEVP